MMTCSRLDSSIMKLLELRAGGRTSSKEGFVTKTLLDHPQKYIPMGMVLHIIPGFLGNSCHPGRRSGIHSFHKLFAYSNTFQRGCVTTAPLDPRRSRGLQPHVPADVLTHFATTRIACSPCDRSIALILYLSNYDLQSANSSLVSPLNKGVLLPLKNRNKHSSCTGSFCHRACNCSSKITKMMSIDESEISLWPVVAKGETGHNILDRKLTGIFVARRSPEPRARREVEGRSWPYVAAKCASFFSRRRKLFERRCTWGTAP